MIVAPFRLALIGLTKRQLATPTSVASAEEKRILLVDDDAMVRGMIAALLKAGGYNIIEADSGLAGLDRFAERRNSIDLVLSDVVMPNMTGVEMLQRILAVNPSIPVAFMTGCLVNSRIPDDILC